MSEQVFESFPKIPRLFRDCQITEKIDGTNAQVYIPEDDGPILAGSRSQWITPEKDNFGFARWVKENETELRKLGYGRHYGEWWGAGIQRKYGLKEKRFSLFPTAAWSTSEQLPTPIVSIVPTLYKGPFDSSVVRTTLDALKASGSVAAPGFMDPEGIIVWHEASRQMFKVTFDDGPKEAR